ncbi:MAG: peptidoglycan-binding protein [Candidatus Electrothrix aestuarii]|uniref:Peptidoglycan-binding protein n=1 Tax=Candidatus Electrothrix aestuarii TaxID=3062594 RepID=A0AAU8LUD3_9BACT|nr:hypothetical protein [Candidatus Electrothrix aestuarii]
MGKLEKMTITACTVKCNGDIKADGKKMKVLINPSSLKHEHSISYNTKVPWGSIAEDLRFDKVNAEKVSFDLVIDGTGVIPGSSGKVKDSIDTLKKIVYQYNGSAHQPSPVCLTWGSFIFWGRLTSLSLEHTLFKPSGEPLRAKANLALSGYMTKEEEALRKNNSSPDLTHTIEVKAGDTLPLLCYKVYSDASYYPEVARVNGLNTLQYLRPGLKLKFPPLQ